MICIQCGAKIPDDPGIRFCPKCKAPLNNDLKVSEDTKVDWKNAGSGNLDKTMILPDFGEGLPVPDQSFRGAAYTTMKTEPQLEFSQEDFQQFDHFDAYGSDPYGIEMPGQPVTTQKNAGLGGDRTVVLKDSTRYENRQQNVVSPKPPREKYFPNGFLQEYPDMEPPARKHRIGVLDILILLLGAAVFGLGAVILKTSGGLGLIRQFFDEDMTMFLDHMNDITYFSAHLDMTWRLYYEIAAIVIITMMVTVIFIVLHCFIKKQGVGILKAVLILMTGTGMAVLCAGYCGYYLITVKSSIMTAGTLSTWVTFAGIGVGAVAVLWFVFMCIWGFTSFFKTFHVASMALLALGFFFTFMLMAFNLLISYKVCHGSMPVDAMYEMMSTPVMVTLFMVISFLAALEDYLAKRIPEE